MFKGIYIIIYTLYPGYCDSVISVLDPWDLLIYRTLKCWTEFELWIYEGSVFQTDEPEHTNVFRYTFKWGVGVYNWTLDDYRNRVACISDAKVKYELR